MPDMRRNLSRLSCRLHFFCMHSFNDQLPQTVKQLNTRTIKVRAAIAIELLRIRNVVKRNCLVQLELPIYFMATN